LARYFALAMTKAQLSREQLARVLYAANLNYFVAVTEAGSIREASRRLNISPSAVSRQILQLEEAVGVPLFERLGSKLRISAAGTALLRHCTTVLRNLETTVAEIDALQELRTGVVRVGTVESASISLLPTLLELFAAEYPLIHVSVVMGSAESVADSVAEGRVDIGFAFNPLHTDRFKIHLRKQYSLGAVLSNNHKLAKSMKVSMAECLKLPLVLPAPGLSIRATLDRVIGRRGNELRAFIETNSLNFMNRLLQRGKFVGIQTQLGIEDLLKTGALVFVELAEPGLGVEEFALITDAHSTLSLAAQSFLDHTLAVLPPLLRL
jgi:DNA-binding transcriptional LysR family regulator